LILDFLHQEENTAEKNSILHEYILIHFVKRRHVMKNWIIRITTILLIITTGGVFAQKNTQSLFNEDTFSGLKLRNVGPAFMSGWIADIAIHPNDNNTWYVGVAFTERLIL
jgi:hypothetical protein